MDYRTTLAAAFVLAVGTACDNEVDLLSEEGAPPVVYGLVDGSRDSQFLSVTRAFRFSDGGSAVESARETDSLYYADEALQIVARNARTGRSTGLRRVDLAASGTPRDGGVFPSAPIFAYAWRLSNIDGQPGDSIVIEGELDGAPLFTHGGRLLPALSFRVNGDFPLSYGLLADEGSTAFRWRRGERGAEIAVFGVGLEVAIEEIGPGGVSRRVLYYPLARDVRLGADRNSINVENSAFGGLYGFLATRLRSDPEVIRRLLSVRGVVTAGGTDYLAFRTLANANVGITATGELPPFSNVTGALGLVGTVTRLEQATAAQLTPTSLDSLRAGALTAGLNFD